MFLYKCFVKYLDRFLACRLGLVVLGLLVLLAPLGQVGVVGQAAEERRHHGAGVHLLLHTHEQTRCFKTFERIFSAEQSVLKC